jgi:hypothetical protein
MKRMGTHGTTMPQTLCTVGMLAMTSNKHTPCERNPLVSLVPLFPQNNYKRRTLKRNTLGNNYSTHV